MGKKAKTLRLFDEANRLWFEEGLTYRALAQYQEVVRRDPTDAGAAPAACGEKAGDC